MLLRIIVGRLALSALTGARLQAAMEGFSMET
jgi:hypothetical protein